MSRAHFVKQCKSKYRCKIGKCGKHHHSLLHEPDTTDKKHPQESKGQILPVLVNSHHKTNALLDSGFDSTQISNVFNTQINHLSKFVEFNISSDMHPNPIKVSHPWVVPHLDLPKSKRLHNIHDWPYLGHNYDVTALIGTDMPQ